MATSNRSSLITKLHRTLKKHYKPVAPEERTVLEQALYACCLQNAKYEDADKVFPQLSSSFFDLNEVRVSSATELSEVCSHLPDPTAAAQRVKRVLQSVFESRYSFELEDLRKENLGKATKQLEAYDGTTPFVVSYVVQTCLAGHSIPLDEAAMEVVYIVGLIDEKDKGRFNVPGLERAIPKSKGLEFGSLLHQVAADLWASRYSPTVHKILLSVNEEAKERLPKRGGKKKSAGKETKSKTAKSAKKKSASAKSVGAKAASAKKKPAKKKTKSKSTAAKNSSRKLSKRRPR